MEVAKTCDLVAPVWGFEAHPSNVIVTRQDDLSDGQEKTKAHMIHNIKLFT